MSGETFTVMVGGDSFQAASFDEALDVAADWLDGPEAVTIISSRGRRWDGPELSDLVTERVR